MVTLFLPVVTFILAIIGFAINCVILFILAAVYTAIYKLIAYLIPAFDKPIFFDERKKE